MQTVYLLDREPTVKKDKSDKRGQLLERLRGEQFDQIRLRARDAVVVRVSDDADEPPPFLLELVARRQPFRVFPVERKVHLIKWPHSEKDTLPEGHSIETGGWDHEHCDGCNRHIDAGRTFWQTVSDPCFWLCPYCYRRLQQLR